MAPKKTASKKKTTTKKSNRFTDSTPGVPVDITKVKFASRPKGK